MLKLKSVAAAFLAAGFIISSLVSCSDGGSSGGSSAPVPKSLTVDASKAKKEFTAGEVFDSEGLEVQVVYSNNAQKDVTNFECTVPAENLTAEGKLQISDNSKRQDVEVTVTALGVTGSYHITIAAEPKSLKLSGTLTAKNYWVGDEFDASGLKVEAAYVDTPTDADYVDVTEYAEFDVSTEESGTKTVKAEYAGKEVSKGEISINVYKVEHSIEPSCSTADEINKTVKVLLGKTDATEKFSITVTENGTSVGTNLTKGTHTLTVSVTPNANAENPVDIRQYTEEVEVFVTLPVEKIELEGLTDSTISLWKGDAVDTSNVKVKVTYVAADGAEAETETLALTASGVVVENLPDGTASGSSTVTVSYGGKDASFTVKVYDITGAESLAEATANLKTDDSVPSLSGVKVVLGEDDVEGSEVALYKDDEKFEKTIFVVGGTYKVIASVGSLKKEVAEFTVAESKQKKFNVKSAKIDGAGITITIDCTDLGLNWAENFNSNTLNATISSGSLSVSSANFQNPKEDADKLVSYDAYIVCSAPPSTVTVDLSATINGIEYSATVSFVGGKYIPAGYVPTELTITGGGTVAVGQQVPLSAADIIYSLDYTDKVTWSVEYNGVGSITQEGVYTAADAETVTVQTIVTIKAVLKENTEVFATTQITIDPSKVDTSNIYAVNIYNKENNGGWGWCELTWTDEKYAISSTDSITNCTMNSVAVQNITDGSAITNGYKFKFITNGATWRGAPNNTLAFRVTTTSACYDITVKLDDRDLSEAGSTTEVTKVEIQEVQELMLSVSILSFEEKTAQTFTVGQVGISDFDLSNVQVESSDTDVATVTIENDTVTVTPVADGTAKITVTYGSLTKEVEVKVQTNLTQEALVFNSKSSKIQGSGIFVYWTNNVTSLAAEDISSIDLVFKDNTGKYGGYESSLSKSYTPTWVHDDGLYFTVANGFQNDEDYTHTVTITIIKDGVKYTGTIVYSGNAYASSSSDENA